MFKKIKAFAWYNLGLFLSFIMANKASAVTEAAFYGIDIPSSYPGPLPPKGFLIRLTDYIIMKPLASLLIAVGTIVVVVAGVIIVMARKRSVAKKNETFEKPDA